MDSKKMINIILIIVVLSLWGTVSYKYINRFFVNNENVNNLSDNYNYETISVISKDTFNLNPLARDPFLNTVYKKPVVLLQQKKTQPIVLKKEINSKQAIPFPAVQYFGYIKSKDKKEELILIKVNNRLERVRLSDNINGLIIKKIYKDSIVVLFNNDSRMFKKQ